METMWSAAGREPRRSSAPNWTKNSRDWIREAASQTAVSHPDNALCLASSQSFFHLADKQNIFQTSSSSKLWVSKANHCVYQLKPGSQKTPRTRHRLPPWTDKPSPEEFILLSRRYFWTPADSISPPRDEGAKKNQWSWRKWTKKTGLWPIIWLL